MLSLSETFRKWLLEPVIDLLNQMEVSIVATKQDLDAAESNLQQAIAKLATDLDAGLAALQAKIDAGATGADLSDEIGVLGTINDSVQAMSAKLATVITPPPAA